MNIKDKIPENARVIMQTLLNNNYEVYIIGGFVRSILMNEEPHDVDLFTDATGEQILELFPNGKIIGNEDRQNKILTVIVDGIEVSQYRSNGDRTETGTSFEEHISTCDLTINAMACDIDGNIIDLVGGKKDLSQGIITFVGDGNQRIKEDPLRILRAIRFASKYNFMWWCKDEIVNNLYLLDTISTERIKEELEKILKYSNCIENLEESEILNYLFPEFKITYNMNGGEKHNETIFEHLKQSYETACSITNDFKLRFAALFHDIGKGIVKDFHEDKTTFYGHEEEGEKIFLKYAKKYKFSNEETKFISFLIKNHMFGYQMEDIKNKTLVKFFNKIESAGVTIMDFVTMMYCDHQGNLTKKRIKFKDFIEGNFFYNKYIELKHTMPFKVKDLEINGNDLMELGYSGKNIGDKLNKLYEMVLDGKIINRKDRLMEELIK
jgi:tRNA nucleotidyltransferase (CCA-adding enzyme)